MRKTFGYFWSLFGFAICVLVVAFFLKALVFQPFVVDGYSMEPSYHDKEYLVVNKFVYRVENPEHTDVVVFRPPDHPELTYIKRVIGLPWDTVKISSGKVYVNGVILTENYLQGGNTTLVDGDEKVVLERKLKDNEYFLMGDNRAHSTDSRYFGAVPKENIIGKAWITVYPTADFGWAK